MIQIGMVALIATISLCWCHTLTGQDFSSEYMKLPGVNWRSFGAGQSLYAEDRGQRNAVAVYVDPDCPVFLRYRAELQGLVKEFGGQPIYWVVLSARPFTSTQVGDFRKLGFSTAVDEGMGFGKRCGFSVSPEVAIFDLSGKMRYRGRIDDRAAVAGEWKSKPTSQDLRRALREILAGQPVSVPVTQAVGCLLNVP